MESVRLEDFGYANNEKILFEGINGEVKSGFYLLQGENGAGKTTLFNILSKEIKNYQGKVFINGKNLRQIRRTKVRNKYISYIPQEDVFLEELSIEENVLVFVDKKSDVKVILAEFQKLLGIEVKTKIKSLSGGERQILNILIGLINDKKIILIDEPFNNLSEKNIGIIKNLIDENKEGKLVIMTDHQNDDEMTSLVIDRRRISCEDI